MDPIIKRLLENRVSEGQEEIDSIFHEELQEFKGKPLKSLLIELSGKTRIDIKTTRPSHYGTYGYVGLCNGVGWCYADLVIKEIAAGTGKYVDVYVVTE